MRARPQAQRIDYDPRRDTIRPGIAHGRDLTTRAGNVELAAELTEWWEKRGFPHVRWEVVPRHNHHGNGTEPTWTVASNLVNGLPPKVMP